MPQILCLQAKVQLRKCHDVVRVAGGIPPDFPKHPPKPVFRWSCRLWMYLWPDSGSPFCTLTVAMDFDDAAVNHGIFHIRPTADFRQDSGKAPCFDPAGVTLDTLFHLPNSSGKSRHGLPVRAIHSTASINMRLLVVDPRSLALPVLYPRVQFLPIGHRLALAFLS